MNIKESLRNDFGNAKFLVTGVNLTQATVPASIERIDPRTGTLETGGYKCSGKQLAEVLEMNEIDLTNWNLDGSALAITNNGITLMEAYNIGFMSNEELSGEATRKGNAPNKPATVAAAPKAKKQPLVHFPHPTQEGASICDSGPNAFIGRILDGDRSHVTCKNCMKNKLFKQAPEGVQNA